MSYVVFSRSNCTVSSCLTLCIFKHLLQHCNRGCIVHCAAISTYIVKIEPPFWFIYLFICFIFCDFFLRNTFFILFEVNISFILFSQQINLCGLISWCVCVTFWFAPMMRVKTLFSICSLYLYRNSLYFCVILHPNNHLNQGERKENDIFASLGCFKSEGQISKRLSLSQN